MIRLAYPRELGNKAYDQHQLRSTPERLSVVPQMYRSGARRQCENGLWRRNAERVPENQDTGILGDNERR